MTTSWRMVAVAVTLALLPISHAWVPPLSYTVDVPAHPFGVVETPDGNWLFVALTGWRNDKPNGIGALRQNAGQFRLDHIVPTPVAVNELAFTHDGSRLIASSIDGVVIFDVALMEETHPKAGALVGSMRTGEGSAPIYVAISPDDRTLFVSDENQATVVVIDLAKRPSRGFTDLPVIGKVPVGVAPVALTFSRDGRWLYSTSQAAVPSWNWPAKIKPEQIASGQSAGTLGPEGAIVVIDAERARTDSRNAVVARVPAEGNPVRIALSKSGRRLYSSARGSNLVIVFDAAKLARDPDQARVATIPVGRSPVPVALIDDDRILVVGNSDRFAANEGSRSTLLFIDASKAEIPGSDSILGTIRTGAFPRELRLSGDGKTLFLTNFASNTVQVIQLKSSRP